MSDNKSEDVERPDGQVLRLEEVYSRRDFCRTLAAGAALVAIQGCGGTGLSRVGTGGLEDDGGGLPIGGDDASVRITDMASQPGRPPDLSMQKQPPPDLAMQQQQPPDLSMKQPPDLAMQQNSCPGGTFDTGQTPNTVQMNTAVYIKAQDTFLCHDGGGFFAVSSLCTHQGCTNSYRSASNSFHCPCHSANFSLNGAVLGGPTNTPLDHYELCLTGKGTIAMDANTIVSASKRYAL